MELGILLEETLEQEWTWGGLQAWPRSCLVRGGDSNIACVAK